MNQSVRSFILRFVLTKPNITVNAAVFNFYIGIVSFLNVEYSPMMENILGKDFKVSRLSLIDLREANRLIKLSLHDLSPYCKVLI